MGLWSGIKYALNSSLGTPQFEPLDKTLSTIKDNTYIQTLLQNLSPASVDWVFATAPNLGELLNTAFNLKSPVLAGLNTITEIANNRQILITISNSIPAMTAFEASITALTALANSSLKQTQSYSTSQTLTLRRNEKIFLISQRQGSLGSVYNVYVAYTSIGNQSITTTSDKSYNQDEQIRRFMSSLYNSVSNLQLNSISYTFISLA